MPRSAVPDIAGLNDDDAAQVMRTWFLNNYEDPAESCPYETAEGGYQWIWGGPCDAREELEDAFKCSEKALEKAVEMVEEDGTLEWSPVPTQDEDDEPDEDFKDVEEDDHL